MDEKDVQRLREELERILEHEVAVEQAKKSGGVISHFMDIMR